MLLSIGVTGNELASGVMAKFYLDNEIVCYLLLEFDSLLNERDFYFSYSLAKFETGL